MPFATKKSGAGLRAVFEDISNTVNMVAAADPSATFVPGRTGYTIHIQKIISHISTDAAETQTFRDTASTPIVLMEVESSPGEGPRGVDYGEQGRELTEGAGFALAASGAGLVGTVVWEGYRRPTGTLVPSQV